MMANVQYERIMAIKAKPLGCGSFELTSNYHCVCILVEDTGDCCSTCCCLVLFKIIYFLSDVSILCVCLSNEQSNLQSHEKLMPVSSYNKSERMLTVKSADAG